MRVVMICPELPSDSNPGSMAPAKRQFESLSALGIDVQVFDMKGPRVVKYGTAIPKLRKLIGKADLVHAHFGYCGWLGLLARTISSQKPPMVMSFMGDDLLGTPYNAQGDLEWSSLRAVKLNISLAPKYDEIIVKSHEMAKVLGTLRCSVIPNGVDTTVFRPGDKSHARQKLGIPIEARVALFPGNTENPRKGFALAERTISNLKESYGQDVQLLPLWGVPPDQVPTLMTASDFMFMTSLIEGSPNVVKEAMACDLPIVGVDVGDVAELLEDEPSSSVCERDPEQLAAACNKLIVEGSQSQGRQRLFELGLDLPSVARRIQAVYDRALDRSGAIETLGQTASPAVKESLEV